MVTQTFEAIYDGKVLRPQKKTGDQAKHRRYGDGKIRQSQARTEKIFSRRN